MEMSRILPILCQFGIGALLCLMGTWTAWRCGYLDLQYAENRRMLAVIIAGYVGLLLLNCVFTFWLPSLGGSAS